MNKDLLKYVVGSFIIVWFLVFIVSTQILGIPWWWVTRGIVPLSGVPLYSRFEVSITPEAPRNIGDNVLVTVLNVSDRMPVEGAKVSLGKNGDHINDYFTNASGQTTVEYIGEVTVIKVSKTEFETVLEAIPHTPAKWVRDQYFAMGVGVISALAGSITTYILQERRKR